MTEFSDHSFAIMSKRSSTHKGDVPKVTGARVLPTL